MNTVKVPQSLQQILQQSVFLLSLISTTFLLNACDSSDKNNGSAKSSASAHSFVPTPVTPSGNSIWPNVKVSANGTKSLKFEWTTPPSGTTSYKLFKKADSTSNYLQIGDSFTTLTISDAISVHLTDWVNTRYKIQACNDSATCVDSSEIVANSAMLSAISYLKASNAEADDWFGWSLTISGDGKTMAVGAPAEDSNAIGLNGEQTSNTSPNSGAVYVFIKDDVGNWQQQAYLKASNTEQPNANSYETLANDRFGYQVALSDDGNTLAVSAILEDSPSTGVNCYQDDKVVVAGTAASQNSSNASQNSSNASQNSSNPNVTYHADFNTGAVYIFKRTNNLWAQNAYIKAINFLPSNAFGLTLAIAGDGKTLAVGTTAESTYYAGIYVQSSSASSTECFNYNASASSSDSSSISSSDSSSISSSASSTSASSKPGGFGSGAVYIYTEDSNGWNSQAVIKAADAEVNDLFGGSISLTQDGNTLVVGAIGEDSKDGSATNETVTVVAGTLPIPLNNGAAYVFTRSNNSWTQQAKIKPTTNGLNQSFGYSVALSGDGTTLAVGTPGDWSKATGINGNGNDYDITADVSTYASGAAYIFSKTEASWSQQAYIKTPNPLAGYAFASNIALSFNGDVMAAGSYRDSSQATGINGDALDTTKQNAGAVYLFTRTGNNWAQKSYVKAPNTGEQDRFGNALALDASGATLVIGAHRESSKAKGVNGDQTHTTTDTTATAAGAVYSY